METDKERKIIYSLLLEEKLEAFFLSFRTQLHVYKVEDLLHVTRKDLSSIGLLSGPDVRRFEKVIGKVTKNTGLKGIFTKVLPKKQKQLSEIPAAVTLWEEFDPVIIKAEDLTFKEILGAGHFGEVYQGEWIRRLGGHEVAIDVAVKCLREKSNQSFIKEVSILSQLDQKHDNIIKLYGISIQEDKIQMVTEYAEQGSLLEKLQNGHFRSVSLLCQFAVQIASGMMYLEQKGLVHRDLAARNILVTAHNQVKISDFGLAKLVGKDNQWVMTAVEVLPLRWMPLESLLQGLFTSASDVWSFGVVLWEMFSFGEHPWESITSNEVIEKLKDGERLPEPQYCPSDIYAVVMKRCWTENASERLKFKEARDNLICVHPTSSFAVSAQQRENMLAYSAGDAIIAVKPIGGQSNIWLGQNERTLEFGRYVKSETQPIQTKIPLTINDSLSPDREKPLGKLPVGERGKPIATSVTKSKPIAIPVSNGSTHATAASAPRPSSLPSRQTDPADTEQGRKISTGAHIEKKSLIPAQSSSNRNDMPISSPIDPFCTSVNDSIEHSNEGRHRAEDSMRRASLPIPDRLASRTTKRYPSLSVPMDDHNNTDVIGDEKPPDLMSRDHEQPDLPQRSSRLAPNFVNESHRSDIDNRTGSNDNGSDVAACRLDPKKDVVRLRPKKPPRVSKSFYVDDSFLQAEEPESQQMKSEATENPYENTGVFDLDPSAWLQLDSFSGKEGTVSNENDALPAHRASANVIHLGPKMKLHIPTKKQNSWKRVKQLRKTQSLESLSLEMSPQDTTLFDASLFHNMREQHGTVKEDDEFEDELSMSADRILYKKLEINSDDEVGKKRSLFGIKLKKKSRKDRYSGGPPANLADIVSEVEQALPGLAQPEIATALEVSKWSASDAIKYLKVSKLVRLGLCPEATCLDMLKTYDWNVLEASYAIKIHYVMAIHLNMSLEDAAKILRENAWNLDVVLNRLKVPAFISESEDIGYDAEEAEAFLEAAGYDIDKALHDMKVRRVADITQKHKDYCTATLEHCQWRVDRAVAFIVEST